MKVGELSGLKAAEDLSKLKQKVVFGKEIIHHWVFHQIYETSFLLLLKEWKKNLPSKEVLADFKKIINKEYIREGYENGNLLFLIDILQEFQFLDDTEDQWTDKDIFQLLKHLLYFGLHPLQINSDNESFFLYVRDERSILNSALCQLLKRALAARIIVRACKKALNDEFEMKPLRTKIDMRKLLEANKKL